MRRIKRVNFAAGTFCLHCCIVKKKKIDRKICTSLMPKPPVTISHVLVSSKFSHVTIKQITNLEKKESQFLLRKKVFFAKYTKKIAD